MRPFDVSHLASKRICKQAEQLCNELKEAIHKYDNEMPIALVLGVLDIVKKEIVED
ncbi:MAG: hypothetical protein JKY22_12190 [Flavobacteriaceae bacterium]|nr:hypothetical protein [Flavobacteriaceae bacterium]